MCFSSEPLVSSLAKERNDYLGETYVTLPLSLCFSSGGREQLPMNGFQT